MQFEARIFWLLAVFLVLPLKLYSAAVEDAAKSEGQVVFYSSLNNEQIKTLVDRFQQKYPAIKASFYRGASDRVLQRITTEVKLFPGNPQWAKEYPATLEEMETILGK